MRNLRYLLIVLFAGFFLASCDDDDPITPGPDAKGNLFVSSVPNGAQIWLDGVNTDKVTPDTIKDLNPAVYNVTLRLQDYQDTTFSVSVAANETAVVSDVELTSDIFLAAYGPVRIWETVGTTADQPSGLDLSSGMAYGIGATNPDRVNVDIYYTSTGFVIQSADLSPNMTRVTWFRVGTSDDLNDGNDSPNIVTPTWTNSMSDREENYVFLYDDDNHYSKLKIVNFGGGTPGNPAWVEVQWFYNNTTGDNRF
jgi:hypothetical protein